jgi:hypothetical protein
MRPWVQTPVTTPTTKSTNSKMDTKIQSMSSIPQLAIRTDFLEVHPVQLHRTLVEKDLTLGLTLSCFLWNSEEGTLHLFFCTGCCKLPNPAHHLSLQTSLPPSWLLMGAIVPSFFFFPLKWGLVNFLPWLTWKTDPLDLSLPNS